MFLQLMRIGEKYQFSEQASDENPYTQNGESKLATHVSRLIDDLFVLV
jgi:hypothetical protein